MQWFVLDNHARARPRPQLRQSGKPPEVILQERHDDHGHARPLQSGQCMLGGWRKGKARCIRQQISAADQNGADVDDGEEVVCDAIGGAKYRVQLSFDALAGEH